jgi:hypothetical protein
MLQDALKLLGVSTPFIYAAATYGVFLYLDRKASSQAKKAISAWLKPIDVDRTAIARALVEVFDWLYPQPLSSLRTFLRSAAFSSIVTSLALFRLLVVLPELSAGDVFYLRWVTAAILGNIISDWLSLFVIRKWLLYAGERPIFSLISGIIVGSTVIVLVFFIRDSSMVLTDVVRHGGVFFTWNTVLAIGDWFVFFLQAVRNLILLRTDVSAMPLFAAIAVHLWLPLFAISVIILQVFSGSLWAAGRAQWFLKQGQHHPLQAVGYVAAAIVFIGTVVAQVIWR